MAFVLRTVENNIASILGFEIQNMIQFVRCVPLNPVSTKLSEFRQTKFSKLLCFTEPFQNICGNMVMTEGLSRKLHCLNFCSGNLIIFLKKFYPFFRKFDLI